MDNAFTPLRSASMIESLYPDSTFQKGSLHLKTGEEASNLFNCLEAWEIRDLRGKMKRRKIFSKFRMSKQEYMFIPNTRIKINKNDEFENEDPDPEISSEKEEEKDFLHNVPKPNCGLDYDAIKNHN